jgi:predicted transposase YbfD/YdcC
LVSKSDFSEEHDKEHGRIGCRKCWAKKDLRALKGLAEWPKLKSIICIESERCIRGKASCEKRYYLSSFRSKAKVFLRMIRDHSAIENSLHWLMDMTFAEDGCRARTKNASENIVVLRRLVANVLRKIKKPSDILKGIKMRALTNESRLLEYIYTF